MNRTKKLIYNTGIFAIANIGSKLLSFLLVPIYTWVLTTEQYGTIDIIITTVGIIIPIMTLNFSDTVLRFSIDSENKKNQVYSLSIMVVIVGNLVVILLAPLISRFQILSEYIVLLYLLLIFNSLYSVSSQFVRGTGQVFKFAVSGLIQTFVFLISNLLFLLVFKLGINGYLCSLVISYFSSFLFIFFSAKLYRQITCVFNKNLFKLMILYALPLIPNAFFWWAMNGADKYVITMYLGKGANGLYAISNKIPTVLNMVNVIFYQAWQLSAVEQVKSADREKYYGDTFKYLSCIMILMSSAILVILKPIFSIWVSDGYYISWQYTPLLLIGTLFMFFSSFWGTNFIALRKTSSILTTTVCGFVINIGLNFLLIPRFGLMAAAFSTAVGYLVTWIVRMIKSSKILKIQVDKIRLSLSLLLIIIQSVTLFLPFYLLWNIIIFAIILLINRKACIFIVKEILKFIVSKKRVKHN